MRNGANQRLPVGWHQGRRRYASVFLGYVRSQGNVLNSFELLLTHTVPGEASEWHDLTNLFLACLMQMMHMPNTGSVGRTAASYDTEPMNSFSYLRPTPTLRHSKSLTCRLCKPSWTDVPVQQSSFCFSVECHKKKGCEQLTNMETFATANIAFQGNIKNKRQTRGNRFGRAKSIVDQRPLNGGRTAPSCPSLPTTIHTLVPLHSYRP